MTLDEYFGSDREFQPGTVFVRDGQRYMLINTGTGINLLHLGVFQTLPVVYNCSHEFMIPAASIEGLLDGNQFDKNGFVVEVDHRSPFVSLKTLNRGQRIRSKIGNVFTLAIHSNSKTLVVVRNGFVYAIQGGLRYSHDITKQDLVEAGIPLEWEIVNE